MRKRFWLIGLSIIMAIFMSFLFIDYTKRQGYAIAVLIFMLCGINAFVMVYTKDIFPYLKLKLRKKEWRIENHKLLAIGMLLNIIGLSYLISDFKLPMGYIVLSTGLFFSSFCRIRVVRL